MPGTLLSSGIQDAQEGRTPAWCLQPGGLSGLMRKLNEDHTQPREFVQGGGDVELCISIMEAVSLLCLSKVHLLTKQNPTFTTYKF